MPRPKSKAQLLEQSGEGFNQIFILIDSLSKQEFNAKFRFEHRDKTIRDVLAHLHEWHCMMLLWYKVGMGGEKPFMPAKGYTWKTTPELNQNIWAQYQDASYDEVFKLINESHHSVKQLILKHSEEELFTKKYYSWTNSTSLASYLISSTSSHYDWAIKLLKKHKKSL
ncbi:MAG: ClbS/DfsB family four-helix bundle protein [Candidatus Cloacimonetes bacterium]|nr:ClbS/DfsB family four-helix bundle protein [Candidatus Cloacimonadota bacterium]